MHASTIRPHHSPPASSFCDLFRHAVRATPNTRACTHATQQPAHACPTNVPGGDITRFQCDWWCARCTGRVQAGVTLFLATRGVTGYDAVCVHVAPLNTAQPHPCTPPSPATLHTVQPHPCTPPTPAPRHRPAPHLQIQLEIRPSRFGPLATQRGVAVGCGGACRPVQAHNAESRAVPFRSIHRSLATAKRTTRRGPGWYIQ